ncbi:calpain-2 catalytic subunit [Striga asiatica]|uniref:Calpain-2 catalytic subunit n=1 Tax=Striga asiatica TaxID=4170 RepID=A0A5A7Q3N8_STRAF|nr:calpain-2 catalytic subunit [Striga asiatica]
MVKAMMGSLHSEDFSEEIYGSLVKRSRLATAPSDQPMLQYNPLDEPSPLGLRLRKSPSLLDLIQRRLSQGNTVGISMSPSETIDTENKKAVKGFSSVSSANEKLKASNFPGLLLRIGSWEYLSRYEGDLVVKCYYAKHKLVWEVLEGGLKSKIEIQWSDIMGLKADCPVNDPGILTIMLARPPAFFRETNPQPRKHTLWQATADFTDGQASLNKLHSLQCPPGVLNKHYEKLIQCDTRLAILSQLLELDVGSPYFEPEASIGENSEESIVAAQLSSLKFEDKHFPGKNVSKEVTSPSSVMDTQAIDGMSMSDLVNHLENRISEQMTCRNFPSARASECQEMLENIAEVLLNDTQCSTGLDEQSLMKKVNSLCSLLHGPDAEFEAHCGPVSEDNIFYENCTDNAIETSEGLVEFGPAMQRPDSFGDLLLHLPRIASLPKFSNFLFGIEEDDEEFTRRPN